jgi:ligand-binding sensor domain-containing protein
VIYETRDGELWIGSDGGLDRFNRRLGTFTHFLDDRSMPITRVRSIIEDQEDVLWVGTDGEGLIRFDRSRGAFKNYKHNANDLRSLSHDRVRKVFEDRYGIIWVGTYEGGLNRFDRDSETFTHFQHSQSDPAS